MDSMLHRWGVGKNKARVDEEGEGGPEGKGCLAHGSGPEPARCHTVTVILTRVLP